jgi:hypothetical protein
MASFVWNIVRSYKIVAYWLVKRILLGPIPQVVNDVWDCDTNISVDTFQEELIVKTVMKLFQPNKELGGPDGWVTSSTLESFLRSIQLMLDSLLLRDSEIELIHIPAGRPIVDEVLKVLETIGKSLESLRKQFEQMRSP